MDEKVQQFVTGLTTELWATVYRKRKNVIQHANQKFDHAAKINQYKWMNLDRQDDVVKEIFRDFVYYIEDVSLNSTFKIISSNIIIKGMLANTHLSMQKLLTFALQMQIETELETTQHDAISSAIKTIVDNHFSKGITAHEAVIHLMECTTMLPGVFCVQMLHFRQKLQDMIHNPPSFSGLYSLQYSLHSQLFH